MIISTTKNANKMPIIIITAGLTESKIDCATVPISEKAFVGGDMIILIKKAIYSIY